MTRCTLLLGLALATVGCAASTRPTLADSSLDSLDSTTHDATFDAPDTAPTDAGIDVQLFEDGAECRTTPQAVGIVDCRRFFAARGLMQVEFTETYICCAGRCFIGQSCLVEDPTRARCDLAERPCNEDEVCCRLPSRRYDCRPRANPICNPPPDGY
jgi:hypothetical protein